MFYINKIYENIEALGGAETPNGFYQNEEEFETNAYFGKQQSICLNSYCIEHFEGRAKTDYQESFEAKQDTILLYFMLDGNFEVEFDNHPDIRFLRGMHNICFLPKGLGHFVFPKGDSHIFYITMSVDAFDAFLPNNEDSFNLFRQKVKQKDFAFLRKQYVPINYTIYKIINEILDYEGSDAFKKIFIQAKVIELLSVQLTQLCEHCEPALPINREAAEKMYAVKDFINNHIGEYYSLKSLAKLVGTNEYTLKKEFKELFGFTVFGYWNEAKMEKAQNMLLHDNISIREISESIGYKNPQHFSTAFKKKFKKSPSEYRKINQ